MKRALLTALVAAAFVMQPASPRDWAQQGLRPGHDQQFVTGQVAHDRVTQLASSIPWYTSLYQAEDTARREGKMIFWLHILGNIRGAT